MIRKYNSIILNIILRCFLLLTLLFNIIGGSSCYFYDDSRKRKYPKTSEIAKVEIRKICEELILPDDFKKIREEVAYTYYDRAFIGNQFSSDLDFDEVKSFFVAQLSKKGWSFHEWSTIGGRTVFFKFEKEAYEISVEGEKYIFSGRKKYAVTCHW